MVANCRLLTKVRNSFQRRSPRRSLPLRERATIVVRTPDNSLYSNPLTINVAAPPTPNYSYIGIISPQNRVD